MNKVSDMPIEEAAVKFLDYCPDTGVLRWKVSRRGVKKGAATGRKDRHGHVRILLAGRVLAAHRLAWFLSYGEWPKHEIDHINGDRADNRIANLRDITHQENQQNRRRAQTNNKYSQLLGVSFRNDPNLKRPWIASIGINGRSKRLGYYATQEEAHEAYLTAKREMHPGNTL